MNQGSTPAPSAQSTHDITTVDGWDRFVAERHSAKPLGVMSRTEYDALSDLERMRYDFTRESALANPPNYSTPMIRALYDGLWRLVKDNALKMEPGVRQGAFVSANAGQGKSTFVRGLAAEFDVYMRTRADVLGTHPAYRDRWVPVAWVNTPPKVTIKGLCEHILGFYGEAPKSARHVTESSLARRVNNIIVDCGTKLLVLDDITRMKMHREADLDAADFIRSLMESSATILGIGIDVANSGILSEGRNRELMSQTRRRFTFYDQLVPFSNATSQDQADWLSHLASVQSDLPLLDKAPDMLTGGLMPDYLFWRTKGVIGSLTRLISETSMSVLARPVEQGGENLSRADFEPVRLDHAAEEHDESAPSPAANQPAKRTPARRKNSSFDGLRTSA